MCACVGRPTEIFLVLACKEILAQDEARLPPATPSQYSLLPNSFPVLVFLTVDTRWGKSPWKD